MDYKTKSNENLNSDSIIGWISKAITSIRQTTKLSKLSKCEMYMKKKKMVLGSLVKKAEIKCMVMERVIPIYTMDYSTRNLY